MAAILFWTICKVRKLTATLVLLQNIQTCKAAITEIPSFIYKSNKEPAVEAADNFYIDITWDHVNFFMLITLFCLTVCIIWKLFQNKPASKLCLEVTCGSKCVILDIITLPMCPMHYDINVPVSITNFDITGHWYSPRLSVLWPGFSIKNVLTNQVIHIQSEIHVSILNAYKLKYIFAKPFFVYLYKFHNGIMIPIRSSN